MRIQKIPFLIGLALITACGTAQPAQTLPPPTITIASTPTELPTSIPTNTPVPPAATAVVIPIDDFEASETPWTAGTNTYFTDSSATSLALTGEHVPQGKQALQLNFDMNDKPKAIFFLDKQLDLSQARYLQFDLFNPGSLASVGIAMLTGADKVWFESDGMGVGAGKQASLSFDLTAATYKAASTNWEFRASIEDLHNVSRLAIIIYPAQSGSIFVDNIRLSDTP